MLSSWKKHMNTMAACFDSWSGEVHWWGAVGLGGFSQERFPEKMQVLLRAEKSTLEQPISACTGQLAGPGSWWEDLAWFPWILFCSNPRNLIKKLSWSSWRCFERLQAGAYHASHLSWLRSSAHAGSMRRKLRELLSRWDCLHLILCNLARFQIWW